jgi:segregation and condensation protein B
MMLRSTFAWIAATTWLGRAASHEEWRRAWQRRRPVATAARPHSITAPTYRTPRLARVEAALFVSGRPLPERRLAQHAALVDASDVVRAVEELNAAYDSDGSAFRIEHVATGYQLLTRPQYAPWLEKVHERRARLRLSPPALETLAIVAYRQPLTRADVEAVRGVQSGEMLKLLMERELVKIVGEHDSLGRPYLYGTTRQFLELFGVPSLADLPQAEGLTPPAPVDEPEADGPTEVVEAA